jgi:hypothetical protein
VQAALFPRVCSSLRAEHLWRDLGFDAPIAAGGSRTSASGTIRMIREKKKIPVEWIELCFLRRHWNGRTVRDFLNVVNVINVIKR